MRLPAPVVAAAAALVLAGGVGAVVLDVAEAPTAFDEDRAVQAFRSSSPSPARSAAPGATAVPSAAPSAGPGEPAPPAADPAAPPAPGAPPPTTGTTPAPAAPPAESGPRAPEPGVYRYATEGYESVDAFGGQRHDYPATTPVTYARTGCGTEERWQPLEERYGAALSCSAPEGEVVVSTEQSREFFGQSQTESYRCDPRPLLRPVDPRPGDVTRGRCASDDSTVDLTTTVVGLEELEVDGRPVPVVHLRIAGRLSGSTRGSSDREVWLRRGDGLLVQALGETDTDADTAGGTVRYVESYRLRLLSTTPRR